MIVKRGQHMATSWPATPLRDLLTPVSRPEVVDPENAYGLLGAHLYAQGLYTKDTKSGSLIRGETLYRVERGDFVYNRLFGWKGSFAIATAENDGCYVSGEFPCFVVNSSRLDSHYLWRYFSQSSVWTEVLGVSAGGTPISRNRLKEDKLLAMTIPLPPLAEQQRIVARIDALAARIEEARGLRRRAAEHSEAFLPSALYEAFETEQRGWHQMRMVQAIAITDRQVDPTMPEYACLPHISGENIESKTCRLLPFRTAESDGIKSANYLFSPNTVLYSKIRPYLRKAVLVHFQGVCSADVYPIRVTSPELDPRYVMWTLIAGPFTEYANRLSGRTRMPKLNRDQLFAFSLAYPTLSEQRRIVAYLDGLQAKVDALKRLQEETAMELDALLPSLLDRAFKGEM
jgi:type I restriction enzyme, S subunit